MTGNLIAMPVLALSLAFAAGAAGAQQLTCFEDEMELASSSEQAVTPEPVTLPPAPVAKKHWSKLTHWRPPSNQQMWKLENLASISFSGYQQADALTSLRRLSNRGMREGQLGAAMLAGGVTAVSLAVDLVRKKHRHGKGKR